MIAKAPKFVRCKYRQYETAEPYYLKKSQEPQQLADGVIQLRPNQAVDRGVLAFRSPLFLQKAKIRTLRMAAPGGRPPGPEPGFRLF
jgi:hypothetical protein